MVVFSKIVGRYDRLILDRATYGLPQPLERMQSMAPGRLAPTGVLASVSTLPDVGRQFHVPSNIELQNFFLRKRRTVQDPDEDQLIIDCTD